MYVVLVAISEDTHLRRSILIVDPYILSVQVIFENAFLQNFSILFDFKVTFENSYSIL